MYKAILFDLDNTLLNYDRCELEAMQSTMRNHKLLDLDGFVWEQFWEAYLKHCLFYWEQRVTRKLSSLEVIEYALRDTFGDGEFAALAGVIADSYWELFCHSCYFEDSAREVLQTLRDKYSLGIISNGIGLAQRGRLKSGGIYEYFESIIVSDEAGYWKPDPMIFSTALDDLKMKPDDVLFVGDSLAFDYQGAIHAGIDFCFYNRNNRLLQEEVNPKYTICNLKELLSFV